MPFSVSRFYRQSNVREAYFKPYKLLLRGIKSYQTIYHTPESILIEMGLNECLVHIQ